MLLIVPVTEPLHAICGIPAAGGPLRVPYFRQPVVVICRSVHMEENAVMLHYSSDLLCVPIVGRRAKGYLRFFSLAPCRLVWAFCSGLPEKGWTGGECPCERGLMVVWCVCVCLFTSSSGLKKHAEDWR